MSSDGTELDGDWLMIQSCTHRKSSANLAERSLPILAVWHHPPPLRSEKHARGSSHHMAPHRLSIRAVQRCRGPHGPGWTSPQLAARRGHTDRPEPGGQLQPPLLPWATKRATSKLNFLHSVVTEGVAGCKWQLTSASNHNKKHVTSGCNPFKIKARRVKSGTGDGTHRTEEVGKYIFIVAPVRKRPYVAQALQ